MKKFGIIGVGGYIAPRHLQAIRDAGGQAVEFLIANDYICGSSVDINGGLF